MSYLMPELLLKQEKSKFLTHFHNGHSKKIYEYAIDELLIDSRYIFTHRKGRQQYGYCTHCNKEFKIGPYSKIHNSNTTCPCCNSKCIVKASGRGRKYLQDTGYFVYYEKSRINPKAIIARGIYAVRDYSGDYRHVKTELFDKAWYLFDMEEGSKMGKDFYYWGSRKHNIEACKSVYSLCHEFNPKYTAIGYSRTSIIEAVKDTPYSWSGWETYDNYQDMVEFFDLYTKYPCVEYLTKLGFSNLVRGKLNGARTLSAVYWRGKNLFSVLKIDKKDLKEIKQKNIDITFTFLKILQISKKNNWNLSIEEVAEMNKDYEYHFDVLRKVAKYTTGKKIINYINKQMAKGIKELDGKQYILITWNDYIQDCIKLQRDITKETVLFPKNLYTAHQNTIKQIKIKEDEKLNIKIQNRLPKLEKLKFEYKGLMIRPAESSLELIDEGKALNHCVGTYAERYAKGETILLFIRKAHEVEKPYFTVEIKDNRISQVRGKHNCSPDDAVKEFIKVFIETKLNKKTNKNKVKVAISA